MNLTPTTDDPFWDFTRPFDTLFHEGTPRPDDQSQASNAPLISVCMPVYNAKRYVGEAIERFSARHSETSSF